MHKLFSAIFAILIIAAVGIGCSRDDRSSNTRDSAKIDSVLQPTSQFEGATIRLYDGGRVTSLINASRIAQYQVKDSTMAYQLDITSFDSLGNVSSHVIGDSGVIREGSGRFTIYGNVVVDTEDSMHLETDYLNWDSRDDRIYTDAFVHITTPNEVVRGWGMEADQRMRRYKILHQVSGRLDETKQLAPNAPGSDN